MNSTQRRMEIYRILQEQITVEVSDLAEQLSVSTMTIRRDLALFEKQGLVVTNYGGAHLNKGAGIEPSFVLKQGQNLNLKQNIAREAAKLITDGDSIIIDCGTTTLQIINYIRKKHIVVITNSWPVVSYIEPSSKIKLILASGEYNQISAGVLSSITIDFYKNFYADTVFISTQGFSTEHGATVPDVDDANVKNAIMNSAKTKILLLDNTKLDKRYLAKHASPTDFDIIITDSQTNAEYIKKLQSVCKRVIVADRDASLSKS